MSPAELQALVHAASSPWAFLTEYCSTQDPRQGPARYPRFAYLQELLSAAERERFVLVPKSRQMLVTWTMVGYFLWRALFRGPGLYLFLSRNERCAEELLARARFILSMLPPAFQPRRTTNSRAELGFGLLGSRLLSLPASPHGPRMYSPSGVFWDEMAFTPYDEQIWTALKPALDSGGRFVGVSSSNGAHNQFARFVLGATPPCPPASRGESDSSFSPFTGGLKGVSEASSLFHIHRIHYSVHPERNHDWKRLAGSGLSAARWNQEQEISFESASDLVYHEFDPVRHLLPRDWRVNPAEPVFRSIDFGYHHPFVLWLQRLPEGDVIVFDEWAGQDATTDQMLHAIRAIDLKHGLREVDVYWTSCDPAGAAAQDSGISPADTLRRAGIKLRYRSSRLQPGIELVKSAFADATGRTFLRVTQNCLRLISDLHNYRWAPAGDEPLKDGHSDHSLDALRYFFVNLESQDDLLPQMRVVGNRW
jgi:hypothetical protein